MAESTGMDLIDAPAGRLKMVTTLPETPEDYYGDSASMQNDEWRGGEIVYHNGTGTGSNKLYIQTATSGRTPTWRRLSDQFVTF